MGLRWSYAGARLGRIEVLWPVALDGAPGKPEIAHDRCCGEKQVDREQPVEADLQIGGFLDLHEGHVVVYGGKREGVERDNRDAAGQKHVAAGSGPGRRVEQVEADLFLFGQNEGCAPKDEPDPENNGDLVCPTDGQVQQISEDDLQDERGEHPDQHKRQDIFATAMKLLANSANRHVEPPILSCVGALRVMVAMTRKLELGSEDQSALILSIMPSGQSLASSDARYFSCAKVRKASRSGS